MLDFLDAPVPYIVSTLLSGLWDDAIIIIFSYVQFIDKSAPHFLTFISF